MAWLLRSLFGSPLRSIRLATSGTELFGGRRRKIAFTEMAGPASASGRDAIMVPLADGAEWCASGFRRADVPDFVRAKNEARRRIGSKRCSTPATGNARIH